MTGIRVRGGSASLADHDILANLRANASNRLAIVRTRAEKWLGGLTALTGLITTAVVVKGPESATDLPAHWRIAVGLLTLVALISLVVSVYKAYQSAYGDPAKLHEVSEQPISTLARRYDRASREAAVAAIRQLSTAIVATVLAVALLAIATTVTWFASPAAPPDKDSVCLMFEGKAIAKIPGDRITVTTLAAGATVSPCE
jgi:hypothetical protein